MVPAPPSMNLSIGRGRLPPAKAPCGRQQRRAGSSAGPLQGDEQEKGKERWGGARDVLALNFQTSPARTSLADSNCEASPAMAEPRGRGVRTGAGGEEGRGMRQGSEKREGGDARKEGKDGARRQNEARSPLPASDNQCDDQDDQRSTFVERRRRDDDCRRRRIDDRSTIDRRSIDVDRWTDDVEDVDRRR